MSPLHRAAIAILCLAGTTLAADPKPKAGTFDLRGDGAAVQDLQLIEVKVEGRDVRGMCWADTDGKAFLVVDDSGACRRIEFPSLKETVRLDLDKKLTGLALSSEGAVVTAGPTNEAFLLNPDTLEIKKKFPVKGGDRIVASPAISTALSSDGKALHIYDLKAGTSRAFPVPKGATFGYDHLTISPDGKSVFTTNGDQLYRLLIVGGVLKPGEQSYDIASGQVRGIMVSPDGKHVCMVTANGNKRNVKDHPTTKRNSTYVYAAGNFRKPEFVLEAGANPRNVAFDPVGGWILSDNRDTPLILSTPAGVKKKDYKFPGTDRVEVQQFLPHPEGGKVLVLTESKLYLAELPTKE
jgi:WD40 repeat protein